MIVESSCTVTWFTWKAPSSPNSTTRRQAGPHGRPDVSAGRNPTRVTGTRARPHDIPSRSQMRSATGVHSAATPGGSP